MLPDKLSRPLRVFLCHSSWDKSAVRLLYEQLKKRGVQPWLDEESLIPGQEWDAEIRKAVRESDVVIVCLSRSSLTKEGYIQKEIKYALDVADEKPDGTIFLIPLRLEECEVPERLRRWHWANYFEERGRQKLVDALQKRATLLGLISTGSQNSVQVTLQVFDAAFASKEVVAMQHIMLHLRGLYADMGDLDMAARIENEQKTIPHVYGGKHGRIVLAGMTMRPDVLGGLCLSGLDSAVGAEIRYLWVDPKYRRYGIGKQLVTSALAVAAEIGCKRVYVEVLPQLGGAMRLMIEENFVVDSKRLPSAVGRVVLEWRVQ